MKLLYNIIAITIAIFWLAPLLCGLTDILAWVLLSHGITTIDWSPLRVLVTAFWTSVGLFVFAPCAVIFANEAAAL